MNLERQISTMVVVAAVLLLWPDSTAAQLPDVANMLQTPRITIGGTSSTEQKVAKVLQELEEADKTLVGSESDLLRWEAELDRAEQRLGELEVRRSRLLGRKDMEGNSGLLLDPALLPQMDTSIIILDNLIDTLVFLGETTRQQGNEVGEALRHARRLQGKLTGPVEPAGYEEAVSLEEVLQYLSELRAAQISVSLLKARRAGLNQELEQSLKESGPTYELKPLPDHGGDEDGRRQTVELRQEAMELLPVLHSAKAELRKQVAGHIKAQLQRVRLEIYEREDDHGRLEAALTKVFLSLEVTQDQLSATDDQLAAATAKLSEASATTRQQLKELRLAPPDGEQTGTFTSFKKWQIQVTVLQHRLYLLDVEQQSEDFKAASQLALYALVRGKHMPKEYAENYAWYLDSSRQDNARLELAKRRDAWRQEYVQLSVAKPARGEELLALAILNDYQEVLDLYDKIDLEKWEIEWCAQVVRFHQKRYEASHRDMLWYTWRIGATAAVLLLALLASLLLGRLTLHPLRKRPQASGWLRYSLFLSYLVGVLFIWSVLALLSMTRIWGELFGFPRIGELLTKVLFTVGDKEVTLLAFGGLIVVLFLTVVVNRAIGRFLERHVFAYFTWDLGIQHAFRAVIRWLVLFAGFALGLEFVGIGLGVLALFAGVIGIGIGFGLQAFAANFISGFTLMFERPIKKGDYVDAAGMEGRVEEIRTRATTLITRDGVSVIVPNSEFVGGKVVNWSHGTEDVRLHLPVGVAYGSDIQLVARLLLEAGTANPRVLKQPPPEVWFNGFGESSLEFELLVWTDKVQHKYRTNSEINYAIDAAFRENGVTIPFPQRDIHMKKED